MKKAILFLTGILFSISAYAVDRDFLEQRNDFYQRQYFIHWDPDFTTTTALVECRDTENGWIKEIRICETYYGNDALDGLAKNREGDYIEYFYENGEQDGFLKSYRDGKLLHESHYKEGELDGLTKNYELRNLYEINYKEGKQNGLEKFYWTDTNEKLQHVADYKNGKLDGFTRDYDINGNLIHEKYYKNGQAEGVEKEYFDSGKLSMTVTYVNGEKEGIKRRYNWKGRLISETSYKNGQREGSAKCYDHNTGKLDTEVTFKDDKPISGYFYDRDQFIGLFYSKRLMNDDDLANHIDIFGCYYVSDIHEDY